MQTKVPAFRIWLLVSMVVSTSMLALCSQAEELWISPRRFAASEKLGNWGTTPLGNAYFTFSIPDNLGKFVEAKVVVIGTTSYQDLSARLLLSVSQDQLTHNNYTDTGIVDFGLDENRLEEIDVSSIFGDIPDGVMEGLDYVSLKFITLPKTQRGNVKILGMRFVYEGVSTTSVELRGSNLVLTDTTGVSVAVELRGLVTDKADSNMMDIAENAASIARRVDKAGDIMTGPLTNQTSITAAAFFDSNNSEVGIDAIALGGRHNSASGQFSTVSGGLLNTASAIYATVNGGGYNTARDGYATVGGGQENMAAHSRTTVSGGQKNLASGFGATVGGGTENRASGVSSLIGGGEKNTASESHSIVGGGFRNTASGSSSTVGGGSQNTAIETDATVGGGRGNTASGQLSTVSSGDRNIASGPRSTVGGGGRNTASGSESTVGGGILNSASNDYSTVSGGTRNTASGSESTVGGGHDNIASGPRSTVGGGFRNTVSGSASFIGGGENNTASSNFATVSGGMTNTASELYATVSGGYQNTASGFTAFIGGGDNNSATRAKATVSGGTQNTASGDSATVAGGRENLASGHRSTVSGGVQNTASGYDAAVPGGRNNVAGGRFSFAAGLKAKATHQGSFVWADSLGRSFKSTTKDQFSVRASGGMRVVTSIDDSGNDAAGVILNSGAGAWSALCDRDTKENVDQVNGRKVLERLIQLPIATWNWRTQDKNTQHMGPMAQDFHAAFGLGSDDTHISTVDSDGVALAAIQGLHELTQEIKDDSKLRVNELQELLLEKEAKIERLEKHLYELEKRLQLLGL